MKKTHLFLSYVDQYGCVVCEALYRIDNDTGVREIEGLLEYGGVRF